MNKKNNKTQFSRRLNSDGSYEHPRVKTWGTSPKAKNHRKDVKTALKMGKWDSDRIYL